MKGKIAKLLVVLLILTSSFVYAESTTPTDTTTTATTWVEEKPVTPAQPSTATTTTNNTYSQTTSAGEKMVYQTHKVVSGDLVWRIAKMYNLTLDQIKAMNPQIKNLNMIYVGQEIIIKSTAEEMPATDYTKVYQGMGSTTAFRNGPGKDADGVPVYSFNIAMAQATFDAEGRILYVFIDGYEIATPNYDGASMPHFSGWPEKEGYNITDHDTALVSGVSVNTPESAAAEVNAWATKRQRGDTYHMNPENEWYEQMDFYQNFFLGKTVAELENWFSKNTTAAGRPIKMTTVKEDELAKLALLTDAEKEALVDVVAGATMSVRDAHGDFLGALANAYANRVEVTVPTN